MLQFIFSKTQIKIASLIPLLFDLVQVMYLPFSEIGIKVWSSFQQLQFWQTFKIPKPQIIYQSSTFPAKSLQDDMERWEGSQTQSKSLSHQMGPLQESVYVWFPNVIHSWRSSLPILDLITQWLVNMGHPCSCWVT